MSTSDEALEAILALRKIWQEKGGRATFEDLGLRRSTLVRSRGNGLAIPQQWKNYPGAKPVEHVWFEELR